MSELKAFVARKIDNGTCDPVPCVEVYLKSEADKVIADKDKEISELQAMLEERNKQIGELKDYSILDIEAIDDERYEKEKAAGKWVPESRVYLKHETDVVIAEKDKEISDLKRLNYDLSERVTENDEIRQHWEEIEQTMAENVRLKAKLAEQDKELRHHKYRKCLDKAAKYLWKRNYWRDSIPAYERQHQWENMAYKHYKHWMELAEKFKEAK